MGPYMEEKRSVQFFYFRQIYDAVHHILSTNRASFSEEMRKLFTLTKRITGYY